MEKLPIDVMIEIFNNINDDERLTEMNPEFIKHIQMSFVKLVSKHLRQGALAYIDRHLPLKFTNAQPEEILKHLAKNGYFSCLIEAQHRYNCHANLGAVCVKAASTGHVDIVKYFLGSNSLILGHIIRASCKSGSLDMVKLVKEYCGAKWPHMFSNPPTNIFPLAERGYVDILAYLFSEGLPLHYLLPAHAAKAGQLEALKFLHEHKCPLSYATLEYAAQGGSLACLKYAHENGCEWTESVVTTAAFGGHYELVKFAVQQGCPINYDACMSSVQGNSMHCLQYLHENGGEWGPVWNPDLTCYVAADIGNLEALKYAHEHGANWSTEVCAIATSNKHEHILKYLHENNCPCPHWDPIRTHLQ